MHTVDIWFYFLFQNISLIFLKSHVRQREAREEERRAYEALCLAEMAEQQNSGPTAEEIEELNKEFIKDARARMFWIYKPRNVKELKVFFA